MKYIKTFIQLVKKETKKNPRFLALFILVLMIFTSTIFLSIRTVFSPKAALPTNAVATFVTLNNQQQPTATIPITQLQSQNGGTQLLKIEAPLGKRISYAKLTLFYNSYYLNRINETTDFVIDRSYPNSIYTIQTNVDSRHEKITLFIAFTTDNLPSVFTVNINNLRLNNANNINQSNVDYNAKLITFNNSESAITTADEDPPGNWSFANNTSSIYGSSNPYVKAVNDLSSTEQSPTPTEQVGISNTVTPTPTTSTSPSAPTNTPTPTQTPGDLTASPTPTPTTRIPTNTHTPTPLTTIPPSSPGSGQTSSNLVTNGGFENGFSGWMTTECGSPPPTIKTQSNGNKYAYIGALNCWEEWVQKNNRTLSSGIYKMQFDRITGSCDPRSIRITLNTNNKTQFIDNPESKNELFTVTSSSSFYEVRVIRRANFNCDFGFDNVRLEKISDL